MGSSTLNLATSVFLHGQTQPAHTALVIGEQAYTYGQFATAAGRVATWLRACAPRHVEAGANGKLPAAGPRVGILAARSLETYAGIVGAAWAGGTYVPLNPKQPASRIGFVIERAKLDALIVDARGAKCLHELGAIAPANVLRPEDWPALLELPAALAPTLVVADHSAYIMFTSGTTGVPKGVVVTVSNIAHTHACLAALYHIGPTDRVSQFFETTFDVSVNEMFACWRGGAAL
ncbi:MAG: hypothetical protein QOE14_2196, partial [Humisphaera sp.]|nr:hypothetical protein [Humisphaera sp.]